MRYSDGTSLHKHWFWACLWRRCVWPREIKSRWCRKKRTEKERSSGLFSTNQKNGISNSLLYEMINEQVWLLKYKPGCRLVSHYSFKSCQAIGTIILIIIFIWELEEDSETPKWSARNLDNISETKTENLFFWNGLQRGWRPDLRSSLLQ